MEEKSEIRAKTRIFIFQKGKTIKFLLLKRCGGKRKKNQKDHLILLIDFSGSFALQFFLKINGFSSIRRFFLVTTKNDKFVIAYINMYGLFYIPVTFR